jgi:hypothetical protein
MYQGGITNENPITASFTGLINENANLSNYSEISAINE